MPLVLHVVDNELRISTIRASIRRVQGWAKRYFMSETSLSEELSAERRDAAKQD
jgi:hypothetical protein